VRKFTQKFAKRSKPARRFIGRACRKFEFLVLCSMPDNWRLVGPRSFPCPFSVPSLTRLPRIRFVKFGKPDPAGDCFHWSYTREMSSTGPKFGSVANSFCRPPDANQRHVAMPPRRHNGISLPCVAAEDPLFLRSGSGRAVAQRLIS